MFAPTHPTSLRQTRHNDGCGRCSHCLFHDSYNRKFPTPGQHCHFNGYGCCLRWVHNVQQLQVHDFCPTRCVNIQVILVCVVLGSWFLLPLLRDTSEKVVSKGNDDKTAFVCLFAPNFQSSPLKRCLRLASVCVQKWTHKAAAYHRNLRRATAVRVTALAYYSKTCSGTSSAQDSFCECLSTLLVQ